MAMSPLTAWIKSYEPKQKESFDTGIPFWGKWVDENAKGIEVVPPYKSTGTTDANSFSPLEGLKTSRSAVQSATILATAWQAWYSSIKFATPPPTPPFLTISSVVPSPLGIAAAYATLLSGLISEFFLIPPDPNTAFLLKGTAIGTLFNAATIAAGVQISGTAPGAPPVPLVLPLIPVI